MADNYYQIKGFEGMNLSTGQMQMSENECDLIRNGQIQKIGLITKRLGYATQRGPTVNAGYKILGLHSFYPSGGTIKQYCVADGASFSDVYTYSPSADTWTIHHQDLAVGAKCEFETFLNYFYRVNYSDVTESNDGTAWSTTTNVTNAPKARYIKKFLNRLYLANISSAGNDYPSRVYYSSLPDPTSSAITWDISATGNWFEVDPDDGDVITGLEVNANRLLVFKENSLHRYDTNTRYKVAGCPGTVSQRSVKNIQGWTIYLHSTGFWGYDGTQSKLLSRSVQPYVDGINSLNLLTACAYVEGDHYYCYVGDVDNPTDDVVDKNVLFDYDMANSVWTIHNLSDDPTVFGNFRDDRSNLAYNSAVTTYSDFDTTYNSYLTAKERAFVGLTNGKIWQFLDGNNDAGSPIRFEVITKEIYFGNRDEVKNLKKLIIYTRKGSSLNCQYKLDDDENWRGLGSLKRDMTIFYFPAGTRARKIQLRFAEFNTSQTPTIEALSFYYSAETLIK